jgi:hypothetical protein
MLALNGGIDRLSQQGNHVNLRYIDWIWHIRGSVPLASEQSSTAAFDRLDPLFRQPGTSYERSGDTLFFRKQDQAAQDKMSIFNSGVLRLEKDEAGPVLRYDMTSRALLLCFLAPLLFLSLAQLTIFIGKYEESAAKAEAKAGKASATQKKPEPKKAEVPMNPIDVALGAPAPDKPKKGKDKGGDDDKKPSPTPAYVFAGIFAALYVVGRVLEDWLIRRQFKNRLEA